MADDFIDQRQGDTWINAIIGAVAMLVLSFVPVGNVVGGGAVAGYLQNTTRKDGAKVGGIAGALTLLPVVFLVVVFSGIGSLSMMGDPGAGAGILITLVFLLIGLLIGAAFTVGLGALGGYLGAMFAEENRDTGGTREPGMTGGSRGTDDRRDPTDRQSRADDAGDWEEADAVDDQSDDAGEWGRTVEETDREQ